MRLHINHMICMIEQMGLKWLKGSSSLTFDPPLVNVLIKGCSFRTYICIYLFFDIATVA